MEYWFRYGVTEIPIEVSEEISCEKISLYRGFEVDYKILSEIAGEVGRKSGEVTILYDHEHQTQLELLRSLLYEIQSQTSLEGRVKIIFSSWRTSPRIVEEILKSSLKGFSCKIEYVEDCKKTSYTGLKIPVDVLESDTRILVTSILPHGLYRYPSIVNSLIYSKLIEKEEDVDVHSILEDKLQILGLCIVGEKTYLDSLTNLDKSSIIEAEKIYTVNLEPVDILIADAWGWPWDSTLESTLHILRLVYKGVREDGMIGLIAECKKGIGRREFTEKLFKIYEGNIQDSYIEIVREVLRNRRVGMVTTLPRTLLENTLHIKSFDTPQEFLKYSLRIYSKNARIRIVNGPILIE
ncbi:MAG: hypothetical protein QXE61_06280 [Nitrososphaerota archaeon]